MIDFKYRPDVDGLRAVAVILVLLFHAGLGFSGGFIGVDVFFVISGFLITGLILKEQQAGEFSLVNFWVRRIRRIIPAASVLVLGVLAAGCFLLLPSDYADLGVSTVAQQLMFSNVYFWRDTGYFTGPADLKPLLHTWSLAVEEQFYLGYPFLLIFVHRFGRRATFVSLGILAVGSLAVSEYGVRHHPTATFFLLPTRAWELLLGGLICFLPSPTRIKQAALGLVSWLSLAAIVAAGWFYSSSTPFPGSAALIPCMATATLIYCSSNRLTGPAALLASRPAVFVGLMSYSLYLWHWPILVFARHIQGEEPSVWWNLAALSLSFCLAWLAWRFVETPFRRKGVPTRPVKVWCAAAATCVLLVGTSVVIAVGDGMPGRFPASTIRLYLSAKEDNKFRTNTARTLLDVGTLPKFGPSSGKATIVVWGDSHAMHLLPGIDEACYAKGIAGYQATYSSTAPVLNYHKPSEYGLSDQESQLFSQAVVNFAVEKNIDLVILAASWSSYARDPDFGDRLRETVKELEELGIHVAIVRDVARQEHDMTRYFARAAILREEVSGDKFAIPIADYQQSDGLANRLIDTVESANTSILNVSPFFVNENGMWAVAQNDVSYYFDDTHLSVEGAKKLTPLFVRLYESVFEKVVESD